MRVPDDAPPTPPAAPPADPPDRAADEARRTDDKLFGRLICLRGWATEAQVGEGLRIQAAMAAKGQRTIPRLGTILVELGYLTHEQADEVSSRQQRVVLVCSGCGRRYSVAAWDPGRSYRCRHCPTALKAVEHEPPPADESAAAPDLLFDPPLPRDVEAVIDDPEHRFGPYVLVDVIGRGGMGVVYRAWDATERRFLALKLFEPEADKGSKSMTETDLKRFVQEGRTAARLHHPNIVQVYEAGEHAGRCYIAMAYIAGETVEGIIRGHARKVWKSGDSRLMAAATGVPAPESDRGVGRLPPRRTAEIVREIALAVHYAHQQGILHRDLKPQNILIDPSGRPLITDFGLALDLRRRHHKPYDGPDRRRREPATLPPDATASPAPLPDTASRAGARDARAVTALTVDGFVVGTPAYMAPEQVTGTRDLDARTDVYGLGTILYECLTGRPPFKGENAEKTASLVLESAVIPPRVAVRDLLPPELENICLKALAKDRDLRYATALDMAQDLERFLRGDPVTARVSKRAQEMPSDDAARRRARTMWIVLAIEGLVIAALLARLLGWW